jgi:hypothetical protein
MDNAVKEALRAHGAQINSDIVACANKGMIVSHIEYGPTCDTGTVVCVGDPDDSRALAVMQGQAVDRWSELYGLSRAPGETDAELRGRLVTSLRGPKEIRGLSATWQQMEDEPMNTIDPVIIPGPHMYSEECHCESCGGHRAKRDAGMHVDIENVKREAQLVREAAEDAQHVAFHRPDYVDPLMSIPCSVVLALCEDRRELQTRIEGRDIRYWSEECRFNENRVESQSNQIAELRAELKAIREKPDSTGMVIWQTKDNGTTVALNYGVEKCPGCGCDIAISSGDYRPKSCPYCLAA